MSLLLRHPPVHPDWRGVCYGASDAPLAIDWHDGLSALRTRLHGVPIAAVVHSGLARCRLPAEWLAGRLGVPLIEDRRLRERDFGAWEGRTWNAIFAETGDAMMGMVRNPGGWAPPGGETTHQLRDRVLAWWQELPPGAAVLAVTHGGPIAALRGALAGLSADRWAGLIPKCGEFAEISVNSAGPAAYSVTRGL